MADLSLVKEAGWQIESGPHIIWSLAPLSYAAEAFRASLSNTLWLVLAAVATMHACGALYESTIHSIDYFVDLAIGNRWRLARAPYDRPLPGYDRGHWCGLTDWAGKEKRHHDGGLRPRCAAHSGMSPREAIHRAALLRFRPIVTTTHGLVWRLAVDVSRWSWCRVTSAIGLVMVGGLAGELGVNAVHDTGRVFVF